MSDSRLFYQDKSLYGYKCLEQRRARGTPDFMLVARPRSKDGKADFTLFVEITGRQPY